MGSCGSCGSVQGDPTMRIVQGQTYRRALTWTRNVDDVQVPLDAADYSAELTLRRSSTYPTNMLVLTDGSGLTLSTVDRSVRVITQIGASLTEDLELGKDMVWRLRIFLTADPDSDTRIFSGPLDVTSP